MTLSHSESAINHTNNMTDKKRIGYSATGTNGVKYMAKAGMPYADSKIARYLTKQIDSVANEKSQREIAAEIGYDKPNMLSMIKRGESKVPLEKVPLLAKALHVDAGHLMRLAMEQYWPSMHEAIRESFGYTVTKGEFAIIAYIRQLTKDENPGLTADMKKCLKEALSTRK